MKKNFLKANWPVTLITAILVGMSIYAMDWLAGMVAVLFAGLLIRNYMKYDADEQASDEWWLKLDKERKKQIHQKDNEAGKDEE